VTEQEWLTETDAVEMLIARRFASGRPRKFALFVLAGFRLMWDHLDELARERVVAAQAIEDEIWNTEEPGNGFLCDLQREEFGVSCIRELQRHPPDSRASRLVRCILGNPFRPATLDPNWKTSTVLALARGIYDERAFDRLPILADALQDAGCDNEEMLSHCRGDGPHARGCWVVDLVLGKA
jgi:hypothetical protein